MTTETWLPVVGYEGRYEVSDQGRVRSLLRSAGGRVLTQHGFNPYPCVGLRHEGGRAAIALRKRVHTLVAAAFLGPRPEGQHIRHLDGDPTNNALTNLRYGTPAENGQDTVAHGRNPSANRTHCAKGHPFDDVNTRYSGGQRRCRICRAAADRERRARLKEGDVALTVSVADGREGLAPGVAPAGTNTEPNVGAA